jgi:hypothetical protein
MSKPQMSKFAASFSSASRRRQNAFVRQLCSAVAIIVRQPADGTDRQSPALDLGNLKAQFAK